MRSRYFHANVTNCIRLDWEICLTGFQIGNILTYTFPSIGFVATRLRDSRCGYGLYLSEYERYSSERIIFQDIPSKVEYLHQIDRPELVYSSVLFALDIYELEEIDQVAFLAPRKGPLLPFKGNLVDLEEWKIKDGDFDHLNNWDEVYWMSDVLVLLDYKNRISEIRVTDRDSVKGLSIKNQFRLMNLWVHKNLKKEDIQDMMAFLDQEVEKI